MKIDGDISFRRKLEYIASLEKDHAPYGLSIQLRSRNPDEQLLTEEAVDYIIEALHKSIEMFEKRDEIPIPDLTSPE